MGIILKDDLNYLTYLHIKTLSNLINITTIQTESLQNVQTHCIYNLWTLGRKNFKLLDSLEKYNSRYTHKFKPKTAPPTQNQLSSNNPSGA